MSNIKTFTNLMSAHGLILNCTIISFETLSNHRINSFKTGNTRLCVWEFEPATEITSITEETFFV